ncbi:MAG TPA: hypothetical protein VFB15_12205 [Candidatus Binataceae bacterium]|jgi:hypothetical protein|nr:hypothetical protein [Candidatus Binataceae bacterium]
MPTIIDILVERENRLLSVLNYALALLRGRDIPIIAAAQIDEPLSGSARRGRIVLQNAADKERAIELLTAARIDASPL